MQQHNIQKAAGSTHRHKRLGIGDSFAGKGVKGQRKRVGGMQKLSAAFEGGQTPMLRRMPKLGGFRNPNRVENQPVNLGDLETLAGDVVNTETLHAAGLVKKRNQPVKILAFGTLTRKLTVKVEAISATAKAAIEKVGGTVELPVKRPKPTKVVKTF